MLQARGGQRLKEKKELGSMFKILLSEIEKDLSNGKVFEVSSLLQCFKELLLMNYPNADPNYHSEKLKKRLKNHFTDEVVFIPSKNPTKSDYIMSSSVTIRDAVHSAAKLKEDINQALFETSAREFYNHSSTGRILYHASKILKKEMKSVTSVDTAPIDSSDITAAKAESVVPDAVYMFLKWLMTTDLPAEDEPIEDKKVPIDDEDMHRKICSVGQDLLYIEPRGELKTPKHTGLAIAVKYLTGSKQLVTMLNRLGHCVSNCQLGRIETALTSDQLARAEHNNGVIIPTNILRGEFIQAAADNNDFCEETLDGKLTTHATTTVLYQRNSIVPLEAALVGNFGNAVKSSKERSLKKKIDSQMIVEYGACGKRPTASNLLGNVQLSWFNTLSDITFQASLLDLGWCLFRMCPKEIFDVSIEATENQAVPGWTSFNMTTTTVDPETTKIGYCPLLPASPTDFSTVFTTLTNLQKMMKSLSQQTTVVTFDDAIYSKAKEVQWRSPDEFKDVVICLGGMHMAQCFLATIGKCFEASGMEDIFIESGVFASGSIPRICNGKAQRSKGTQIAL